MLEISSELIEIELHQEIPIRLVSPFIGSELLGTSLNFSLAFTDGLPLDGCCQTFSGDHGLHAAGLYLHRLPFQHQQLPSEMALRDCFGFRNQV